MDAHHETPRTRRTRAQRLGEAGEAAALAFLQAAGLRLLARNVRFKLGELDLVMLEDEVLVFVEVRRRGRAGFGDALDSVDARKARKLALAARLYLQRQPAHERREARFDVVALDAGMDPHWVRGAFTLDDL